MIVFLAHWCPHCNAEAPRLAAYLESQGGVPAGVELTVVPTGSESRAPNWPPSQWVKDMRLGKVRALVDDREGTAAAAFGLAHYPFIVMVDKDGNVVARRESEQADGFFAKAFAALAAGRPIPSDA
jgi:thiol-disulfide isomerase/thioredoxin